VLRTQTTTTRTAGIPTHPGSSYELLAPQHELSVIIGQTEIHYSSNGKITTVELYLWRQNTHFFSVFPIESAQHVVLFLWIGSKNDRVFLLGSGYGSVGSDTVRINAEFVTLTALSWQSGRRVLQRWDRIRLPESTPGGFCVFISDPDPESKICEKPDPDPDSLFHSSSSRSLCGHFLGKNMMK